MYDACNKKLNLLYLMFYENVKRELIKHIMTQENFLQTKLLEFLIFFSYNFQFKYQSFYFIIK